MSDKNCVCAKCRAEQAHNFDLEPHAEYDKRGHRDDDPNGDKNCVCAKCRAEQAHNFDLEPHAEYDRRGYRMEKTENK